MLWRLYIGKLARHLAKSRWLRVSLCLVYAAALLLQLEPGRYDHHHRFPGMEIAGTVDGSHCNADHDGATKHCHTVSIVSLCAPATANVASLDYPHTVTLPPKGAAFSDLTTRPQFRPPRIA